MAGLDRSRINKLGKAFSIIVVDDRPLVVAGLQCLLRDSDIDIAAHALQKSDSIQLIHAFRPNVVVMETRMHGHDSLHLISDILELGQLPVVVYSSYSNQIYVARAIAVGAVDYVLKTDLPQKLIVALRGAFDRVQPDEESLFGQVKKTMSRRSNSDDPGYSLTRREMQVLRHVGMGLSNREIASSLKISLETVKEHVQNVLRKTNATDRTQAAVLAVKLKLV